MKTRIAFLLWLVLAVSAAAQPLLLEGPLTGYLFDARTGSIRPIVGLPGAAYVGDALAGGLEWADIAPAGGVALARKDGVLYAVRGLGRPDPVWNPIENASITPDRAAWSPDAAMALIYCSTSGQAQLVRNLLTAPAAGKTWALGPGAGVLALDSEARIVAGFDDGLYLLNAEAASSLLAPLARPRAVLIAGSRLLAAGQGGEILEIEDYAGHPKAMALGEIPEPVGLALASDGRTLYVASRSERAILIYDLASRTPMARLALDAEPMTLSPLAAASAFLVRQPVEDSEPLLVLKVAPEPGIWFVPVGKGE